MVFSFPVDSWQYFRASFLQLIFRCLTAKENKVGEIKGREREKGEQIEDKQRNDENRMSQPGRTHKALCA
jgi:hypothetical protein